VVRNRLANQELNRLNDSNDEAYQAFFWQAKLDEITKNS
jgi:hypothetical protein